MSPSIESPCPYYWIITVFTWALFDRNYSTLARLNFKWGHLTTCSLMAKKRWSTDAWKLTCTVLHMNSPNDGQNSFVGRNIPTTQVIIPHHIDTVPDCIWTRASTITSICDRRNQDRRTRRTALAERRNAQDTHIKLIMSSVPNESTNGCQEMKAIFWSGRYSLSAHSALKQRSLAKSSFEKLSPRYFSPYMIIQKVGTVAYELQLPPDAKVHPIFHVSLLQPAKGMVPQQQPPPLPISFDWELIVEPERIISHCWVPHGSSSILELLIQWQHCPPEKASQEQFPAFPLEDNASFQGWGIDTTPLLRTYVRRPHGISATSPAQHGTLDILADHIWEQY